MPLLAAQLSTAVLLNISISAREQLVSASGLLDALTAAFCTGAVHHAIAIVDSLLCAEAHCTTIGARRPRSSARHQLLRRWPGAPRASRPLGGCSGSRFETVRARESGAATLLNLVVAGGELAVA